MEKKELKEKLIKTAKARGFVCEASSGKVVKDLQLTFNQKELLKLISEELDKAREEGIKEYIDLLQGIEHYEGLKMVRGLAGLDKHEKRDYHNLQRRFEELSKLKDNK